MRVRRGVFMKISLFIDTFLPYTNDIATVIKIIKREFIDVKRVNPEIHVPPVG